MKGVNLNIIHIHTLNSIILNRIFDKLDDYFFNIWVPKIDNVK